MFTGTFHLRALGYFNNDPFTAFTKYCWNIDCPHAGNSVDFLKLTLQLMNSTADVVHIDADSEGTIDMISNGTADISLTALRQTRERMQKVDFTTPLNYLYYGYLIKEIPELQIEDYILDSFNPGVIVLLITCGVIVGSLIYFYSWLLDYKEGSWLDWVFTSCKGLLRQFRFILSGPVAALLLVSFWLYFCMITISYYEAKLKSFLTLSHERGTIFTTLDGVLDAIEKKGWTMVLQERGYNPLLYCNPSQCARILRLPSHKIAHISMAEDLYEYVTREKTVGFSAYTYDMNRYPIARIDYKKGVLFVRDEQTAPEYLAYAIRKNVSGLRERFNRAIAISTDGYQNVGSRYYKPYLPYSFDNIQGVQILRNSHFAVLYKVSAELLAGAVLLLILELIVFHYGETLLLYGREHVWGFKYVLHIQISMFTGTFHLRALGYLNNVPFTSFTKYCWNIDCPHAGNSVDFLKLTLQLMNSTADVIQIDADSEETIDMICNGSADISLLALRQTRERMQKVDFTTPINYLYYGYLIKEIPELQIEDYILASFRPGVIVLLVVFGLIVGSLIYFYSWLLDYKEGSWLDWVFTSCKGLLRQFRFILSGPVAALLLVSFWLYFCMITISYYEAKLKSFLTLSHERGTIFTTLDGVLDAIEKKGWTMVLQERGYNPLLYCNPSQCARILKLPSHKIAHIGVAEDLNEYVTKDKTVGFSAYTYDMNRYPIARLDYKKGVLFVRDEQTAPEYLAYAVRKNVSGLRERFNRAIAISTDGYPNVGSRYYAPYLPYSFDNIKSVQVLRNSHFAVLYKVSGELLAGAVLLLILELIVFHYGESLLQYGREHVWGFKYVLHIQMEQLKRRIVRNDRGFQRASTIILPIRRISSITTITKYHTR